MVTWGSFIDPPTAANPIQIASQISSLASIPNWDLDSLSVDLFSSSSSTTSYEYTLQTKDNYILKKVIILDILHLLYVQALLEKLVFVIKRFGLRMIVLVLCAHHL